MKSDIHKSNTIIKNDEDKKLVLSKIKIEPLSKQYIDQSARLAADMFAGPNAHDPSITGNMQFDSFYHIYKWFLTRNIETVVIALLPQSIFKKLDNVDNDDSKKLDLEKKTNAKANTETETESEKMMVVGVIQLKDHFDEEWVSKDLDLKYGYEWHMSHGHASRKLRQNNKWLIYPICPPNMEA